MKTISRFRSKHQGTNLVKAINMHNIISYLIKVLLKLFICKIDAELLKTVDENVSGLRKETTIT